jgi:hypothetical protein
MTRIAILTPEDMNDEQRAVIAWTAAGFANRYDEAPTSDMEKDHMIKARA